jgi:hypothetical protein
VEWGRLPREPWIAAAVYLALGWLVAGPALIGKSSLAPDTFLDRDALLRVGGAASEKPRFDDTTPVTVD